MAAQTPTTPLHELPEKPATPKLKVFRPEMPQIPGLNDAPRPETPTRDRFIDRSRIVQIGAIAFALILGGGAILWWFSRPPRTTVDLTASTTTTSESTVPDALPPFAIAREGPAEIASVEELSKPWASKKFTFVKPFTHEALAAMVIRLPGGVLWGFSLQEPYGQCQFEFVTDLRRLATQYGYRASHPMVVNPCKGTVYDPLAIDSQGGSVWVRGEIVHGSGLRPPIAIDVRVKGRSIIASGIE